MASPVLRVVAPRRRPFVVAVVVVVGLLVSAAIGAATPTITTEEESQTTTARAATTVSDTKREFRNNEYLTEPLQLPDVSHLAEKFRDKAKYGDLVAMLDVWKPTLLLGSSAYRTTKDLPFTIVVPKIDAEHIEPERCAEFLLEHLVPGVALSTFNDEDVYGNLNGHAIVFEPLQNGQNESQWLLNGVKVLRTAVLGGRLSAVFIDGVLGGDRKAAFAKRNIQEPENRYNAPERLEMKNATKEEQLRREFQRQRQQSSVLLTFLAGMKSGTKVFQHFLNKSKLSMDLDDSPYTILIPSDNAFQRWHPIDWGFYPFSVNEFTESVLRNHFLQLHKPLRMADVQRMEHSSKYKTLGGEVVVFRNNPSPSVNNVSILRDYTLPNGNEVFLISEVLFVSEAVVSRLHQMHKDKETPPLLAFPWFGAQFLSHSFLALERDIRFSQITRFLNSAEIAQFVSGANYTFFVPTDAAFEQLGFDRLPDEVFASEAGVKLLLNHFIRGRLYERDLRHDDVLETIGGSPVKIEKLLNGTITVNHANIVQSEIFVYNLGTMFYIDRVLYPEQLMDVVNSLPASTTVVPRTQQRTQNPLHTHATLPDVETVHDEFTPETNNNNHNNNQRKNNGAGAHIVGGGGLRLGSDADDGGLLHDDEDDDEIVTPRALPVKYNFYSPK